MRRHAFTSEFNKVQVRLLKQGDVNFFHAGSCNPSGAGGGGSG